jgi:hypothetical protein
MAALPKEDYERRKAMIDEFKQLSKPEYEELFRILKFEHVSYTENSNGIHFDLGTVSDEVVVKLQDFLQLVRKHAQEDAERTKTMNTLRHESETH